MTSSSMARLRTSRAVRWTRCRTPSVAEQRVDERLVERGAAVAGRLVEQLGEQVAVVGREDLHRPVQV